MIIQLQDVISLLVQGLGGGVASGAKTNAVASTVSPVNDALREPLKAIYWIIGWQHYSGGHNISTGYACFIFTVCTCEL